VSPATFIALEGLDGTGKSTVAAALARRLGAELLRTPPAALAPVRPLIDEAFESSPTARQLFYAATVAEASDRARRTLDTGRSVVIDRYWFSTVAYARVREGSLDLSVVEPRLLRPHLTVFLELEEPLRHRRVRTRGATAADERSLVTGEALARCYDELLATPFAGRVLRIDTGARSVEATVQLVREALSPGRRPVWA
jgi:thymidylate kinase